MNSIRILSAGDHRLCLSLAEEEKPLQDGDALSIAEAYPDAEDTSALLAADNEIGQLDANEQYPVAPADPIVPAPVAPQQDAPVKKNKKKVVAAPAPVEAEDDEEDYEPSVTKAGRPSAAAQPWSYFPMHFGSTSGGAIAVANSFSTGKGGTATSHATAYGSSAAIKKRRQN